MIIVQAHDKLNIENYGTPNYKEPFSKIYPFWGKILVIGLFLDYIIYRSSLLLTSQVFSILSYFLNYALFVIFICIVLYKFYMSLFNSKVLFSLNGIVFLISGILKIFIQNILLYHIVEVLFFISLTSLYLQLLLPVIRCKNISEKDRGALIFVFIMLMISVLNSLIISFTSINAFDILNESYNIFQIYVMKLSSYSFLIFILYYGFSYLKDTIISDLQKSFFPLLISLIFCTFLILIFQGNFYMAVLSLYNSLQIFIYLPVFIYIFVIIVFFIAFLSSFIYFCYTKQISVKFIAYTMLILSGLDMSSLYLRLVSLFALMEIYSLFIYKNYDEAKSKLL